MDPRQEAQNITRQAARRVDEMVFQFGYLEQGCPERCMLEGSIASIINNWAHEICELGGIPGENWKVEFKMDDGIWVWEYPVSRLFIDFTE